jgi:hypothetical protein
LFVHGQRLGVDVLPRHFYSEIPVIRELRRTQHWRAAYSLFGVDGVDIPSQVDFLIGCSVSTAVCLIAAAFAGYEPQVTCVEPYPTQYLVRQHEQGTIDLVRLKAQDVPRDALTTLFFTHESVLLHAFLAYNPRFRVAASLSLLHY